MKSIYLRIVTVFLCLLLVIVNSFAGNIAAVASSVLALYYCVVFQILSIVTE